MAVKKKAPKKPAKKTTPKPRNRKAQDATLINVDHLKKELELIRHSLRGELEQMRLELSDRLEAHSEKLTELDDTKASKKKVNRLMEKLAELEDKL